MISGGHTAYTGNEGVSQGWFITGTVTEYSWQQGHESAPHRQTGHCYLAGRSWLSPLISAVRSEENTSHQCIFTQPRVLEGTCRQNMVILYFLYLFWRAVWNWQILNNFSLRNTYLSKPGPIQTSDNDSTRPEDEPISAPAWAHTEVGSQRSVHSHWDRLLVLLNTKSSGRHRVRERPDEKYMYKYTFGDRLRIMWHSKPEENDCQWDLGILLKKMLDTYRTRWYFI